MPVVSYYSTTLDSASAQEAVDTTSSQIFLSRGVADSDTDSPAPPQTSSSPSVASIVKSSSKPVMALADTPRPLIVDRSHRTLSLADETSRLHPGVGRRR